jgi:hypothetical protein
MLSRLRLIDGVQHVTLAESAKPDTAVLAGSDSSGSGGSGDSDCRYSDNVAKFDVLIIFAAPPAVAAPAAPAAAGTAAAVSQTTTTGSTP